MSVVDYIPPGGKWVVRICPARIRRLAVSDDCRVSIGERQGNGNVFATIWRREPTMSVSGWRTWRTKLSGRDRTAYERSFATAEAIVSSVREMLVSPYAQGSWGRPLKSRMDISIWRRLITDEVERGRRDRRMNRQITKSSMKLTSAYDSNQPVRNFL